MYDEARSGHPSLVNDDLVCNVNERVRDNRRFTVSDMSLQFPQISRTLLYDIVSSHLGYRKCVHDGCPRYSQRSTKKNCVLHVL